MHGSGRVWCVKNGEDLEPFIMWMMSAGHKVDVEGEGRATTNNTLDVRAPLLIRTLDVKRLVLNFALRLGACNSNVCPSPPMFTSCLLTRWMITSLPFFDFGCLLAHCLLERKEKPYHVIQSITDIKGSRSNIKAYLYVHSSINTENVFLFPGLLRFLLWFAFSIIHMEERQKMGKAWEHLSRDVEVRWT